jgi:hypothetical protein
MTTQQHIVIAHIDAALEAERFQAEQAARPVLSERELALNLYHAMMAAKQTGKLETARALAAELKPLLSYLD